MKGRSDDIDRIFGASVRNARKAKGWSQEALSSRIGTSFQQLQKYENGKNRVPVSRLLRISAALGEPVERLLRDAQAHLTGRTFPSSLEPHELAKRDCHELVSRIEDMAFLQTLIDLLHWHLDTRR